MLDLQAGYSAAAVRRRGPLRASSTSDVVFDRHGQVTGPLRLARHGRRRQDRAPSTGYKDVGSVGRAVSQFGTATVVPDLHSFPTEEARGARHGAICGRRFALRC